MRLERVATVLGVVASVAVVLAIAVALAAYVNLHGEPSATGEDAPRPIRVKDPATGAVFEVPADRWRVRDRRTRIYYVDAEDRPEVMVRGPAVYRDGYCRQRPHGSNRAFAGFTRQGFGAWLDAVARSDGHPGGWTTGVSTRRLRLADGSTAQLSKVGLLLGPPAPCSGGGVELSMVQRRDVRLVLVRDTGEAGTLADAEATRILASLLLPPTG